jgi:MFS family permease
MTQALPPLGGAAAPPRGRGQRGVLAAIGAIAIFGIAVGMTHPLLALRLEALGYSSGMIGVNGAMVAIASLMLAPVMPPVIRRLGLPAFLTLGAVLAAASLAAFPLYEGYGEWLALRFVLGVAATALFVGSEAWIVAAAEPGARGRIIGLYATVLSIGFAAGPMILIGVGVEGATPFLVCAALSLVCVGPIVSAWRDAPAPEADDVAETPPLRFILTAPTVFGAVILFGAIEFGVMALLPVWGVRTGLDRDAASFLVSALVLGNVALQIPLGALAEVVNRRLLLVLCAGVSLAAAAALPFLAGETWRLWAMLFVWGGLAAGLYTVALIELGARYSGATLVSGTAAVVTSYGIGALIGPLFVGGAMDLVDPHGLAIALGVMTFAYLWVAILRAQPRKA